MCVLACFFFTKDREKIELEKMKTEREVTTLNVPAAENSEKRKGDTGCSV
jgi:hypothetical protein